MSDKIFVGNVAIGGGAPVSIQSMTNTDTRNVLQTVAQIKELQRAGCEIIRVAVPDMAAAEAIDKIKEQISIPLVADIHFDWRLAIAAAERGADKIRINPGNIGDETRVDAVLKACRKKGIPIRIGINSGSIDRDLAEKYGVCAEAMIESALRQIEFCHSKDFYDICVSLKAANVPETIKAYWMMAERTSHPLHLGVTEAGTEYQGIIKSSMGIGALLCLGIGDTIRVSLTADPIREIKAAKGILQAAGCRNFAPEIISCPTCGRCRIDVIKLTEELEKRIEGMERPLKLAVMGCAVNGPGEARMADAGIAGGNGEGVLFRNGEIIKKVPQERLIDELMALVETMENREENA